MTSPCMSPLTCGAFLFLCDLRDLFNRLSSIINPTLMISTILSTPPIDHLAAGLAMSLYDDASSQTPQIDAEALWFQMIEEALPAPDPHALGELERLAGPLKEDLLAALPEPSERCTSSSPERRAARLHMALEHYLTRRFRDTWMGYVRGPKRLHITIRPRKIVIRSMQRGDVDAPGAL